MLTSREQKYKKMLAESGYKNVPPSLLKEFIQTLKAEEEEESDEQLHLAEIEEEEEIEQEFRPLPKNNPKELPSALKVSYKNQSKKDEGEGAIDSSKMAVRKSYNTSTINKVHHAEDDDDEIAEWSHRIDSIKSRAEEFDQNMQQCRTVIMESNNQKANVDVPMYFGTSERKLDPYPAVKKENTGGFIRPPPVKPSKKALGLKKKTKGRRLLYEERFPDYIPPPERRRDSLRWSIRQKLIYSHPDYQK